MLALVVLELLQVAVLGIVAFALGWRPDLAGVPFALLVGLLGTSAFGSLGLLLAGLLRAEATLAAANLVYLLLMAGGGVVLPSHSYGAAGHVLVLLPSGALGDGLRSALESGSPHWGARSRCSLRGPWPAPVLTARTFSWE